MNFDEGLTVINQKFFADGSYHIKNFLDNESKEIIKEVIFESFKNDLKLNIN